MKATELIFRAAGEPAQAVEIEDDKHCGLCGGMEYRRGLYLFGKNGWVAKTFTNFPEMRDRSVDARICEACLFCTRENFMMAGKEKLQRMRTYSHLVAGDSWEMLTKCGDHRKRIKEFLLQFHTQHWCAVIAVSGQKHIIFRSPVNPPRTHTYAIQVEEKTITLEPPQLQYLSEIYDELYTCFSKKEIDTDSYSPRRIGEFGVSKWKKQNDKLKNYRGTNLFALVSFLAVKQNEEEGENDGTTGNND